MVMQEPFSSDGLLGLDGWIEVALEDICGDVEVSDDVVACIAEAFVNDIAQ